MTERILEIIRNKKITPSQFADEIGIQRSTLSHLVAGRNKPSLEVVQKIISRFPEIDVDWLVTGRGSSQVVDKQEAVSSEVVRQSLPENEKEEMKSPDVVVKQEILSVRKKKAPGNEEKQVEKILFFYSDKTFSEYLPG